MALRLTILFCLIGSLIFAQTKPESLYGTWVMSKTTFLSGEELPDENIIKHTYLKYTFAQPNQMYIAGIYYDLGTSMLFELNGNLISVKTSQGFAVNTIKVLAINKDSLVTVTASKNGFEDHTSIKQVFIRESVIQDAMPTLPSAIFRVNGTDTLYNSGQKLYAKFEKPAFEEYISYELYKRGISSLSSGTLLASFIVDKKGKVDSLKILESISPAYDSQYIKVFNSAKNMWKPAQLNGKSVTVLMYQKMQYLNFEEAAPNFLNTNKAHAAYNQQNYALALYYYNLALESNPNEIENLYRRGICKQKLLNQTGACEDWKKVKLLGGKQADELIAKYCN